MSWAISAVDKSFTFVCLAILGKRRASTLEIRSRWYLKTTHDFRGFPGSSDSKESACNGGDSGLIPGSGRFPGEGNGYPLQYSYLGNPMDRGAWWAVVHGVAGSQTRLSDFTFTFHFHALEKEMATHSSVLALKNPRDGGTWWAAICGVAQSRTRLKRLSRNSSQCSCLGNSINRGAWQTTVHGVAKSRTQMSN